MAHSSFSAEQLKQIRSFGSFRDPLYPEPDAIGKEAEESSSDESSEDATVPSPLSISSLSTEDERLDLEDVVPDIDQQIAQPTGSPTESLMDIDGENIRVEDALRGDAPSPPNNTEDAIMERGDTPSPPNNTEDPIMERGDTPSPPNNTEDPIMENIEYHPSIADTCIICHKECTGIFLLLCCEPCLYMCRPCAEHYTQCPHCDEPYVM